MYTALSLTDAQVVYLKDNLECRIGDLKSAIRPCVASGFNEDLKCKKGDIQNMLDQIEGKKMPQVA